MDHHPSLIEWLPGLCLVLAGLFNLICGIQCALQIRAFLHSNEGSLRGKDQEDKPNAIKEIIQPSGECSPSESSLRQIHTRFDAIDTNKDNKISKEELALGFENIGMQLSDSELTMIFDVMDTGQKGYIDLYDFETWWLREKNLFTAFLV